MLAMFNSVLNRVKGENAFPLYFNKLKLKWKDLNTKYESRKSNYCSVLFTGCY